MRVVVNAWFWERSTTGTGQYTRQLVEHLAAVAPDLEIVLVAPSGRVRKLATQIPRVQIWMTACRRGLPPDLHKVWFEQVTFPRVCHQLGADVGHVPYWAPPLWPSIPTIVTIHDLIPLMLSEYRGGLLVRLYTALVRRSVRSAALVITDSEASRSDIVTHLSLPVEHVRVVYLAVSRRYGPCTTSEDTEIRTRYGLPERYALYLGGFDLRKNLITVFAAYRSAGRVIGKDCPLVIAGRLPKRDTPFAPDPRRVASEQGVGGEGVRFIGFVDEVDKAALYRGAVAFIFPTRYEGFGLPPLEALACGTPVVGSDRSSLPEVVGDGGVLHSPDDAEGIARTLIRLATDKVYRAELSQRAVAQASKFTWERAARETLAAYRSVRPE